MQAYTGRARTHRGAGVEVKVFCFFFAKKKAFLALQMSAWTGADILSIGPDADTRKASSRSCDQRPKPLTPLSRAFRKRPRQRRRKFQLLFPKRESLASFRTVDLPTWRYELGDEAALAKAPTDRTDRRPQARHRPGFREQPTLFERTSARRLRRRSKQRKPRQANLSVSCNPGAGSARGNRTLKTVPSISEEVTSMVPP